MKITSSPLKTPAARNVAGSRVDGVNQANVPSSGASSAGKGTVGLSAAARHLAGLQGGEGDINVARVNEIRDALASGQLKIDPSRIADGLIASVRDLLK